MDIQRLSRMKVFRLESQLDRFQGINLKNALLTNPRTILRSLPLTSTKDLHCPAGTVFFDAGSVTFTCKSRGSRLLMMRGGTKLSVCPGTTPPSTRISGYASALTDTQILKSQTSSFLPSTVFLIPEVTWTTNSTWTEDPHLPDIPLPALTCTWLLPRTYTFEHSWQLALSGSRDPT